MKTKVVSGTWLVEETTVLDQLIIEEGGALAAPAGKFVDFSINGIGKPVKPGRYVGDIVLTVADVFAMPAHGLMNMFGKGADFKDAIVVEDGKVIPEKGVPALIRTGTVTDQKAQDVRIASCADSFNGILVTGNSEYIVDNAVIELDGFSGNDFLGVGAGIAAIDNAHVTINNSTIKLSSVTRCAVHAGGDSVVTVNNCKLTNFSADGMDWLGEFSWGVSFIGGNRLVQLCDNATVYYNNCNMDTNGWGVFSIDGCDDSVRYFIKDCRINLSGTNTHGYGAFCIGDRNSVSFDHCKVHVNGYPLIVRGMTGQAKAEIVNGCEVTGERFGVFCVGDNHTQVQIADSSIETFQASLVIKGSSTNFQIRNAKLTPKNGVILQLMDNDEVNEGWKTSVLPIGIVDEPMEGRDLSSIDPSNDVVLNFSDMNMKGNLFNSTTNIHMEKNAIRGRSGKSTYGGLFDAPPAPPAGGPPAGGPPPGVLDYEKKLRGPKNVALIFSNVRYEGVASSANAAYRDGLTEIEEDIRLELSNITQSVAPTINNGVIVSLDKDSTWVVTGTSYITALTLEPGAILKGTTGKSLQMTVDGTETPIAPGHYQGKIVLELI